MQKWLPRGDFDHGAEFCEHVNANNAQLRQVVVGNVDVNVNALVSREALPQSTLEAAGQDQLQDQ